MYVEDTPCPFPPKGPGRKDEKKDQSGRSPASPPAKAGLKLSAIVKWSAREWKEYGRGEGLAGFPPTLENLEKWDNFFQSGKSQGISKKY